MLTWALLLIALGLLLLVVEAFVPGGILAIAGILCLIAGVVMMFMHDTALGVTVLVAMIIALPIAGLIWLNYFWKTRYGRRFTVEDRQNPAAVVYDPNMLEAEQLVGATGTAVTDLRPVGTCKINDRRLECLSESGWIEAGLRVQVTRGDDNQVRVRRV